MTKEQEEAIEILSDSNILFNIQRDTALSIRVAIETVLSMLKEKDKYIKNANDITTEMSNDIKKLTSEIEKKDKQIAKYEKIYKEYDCYRWVKELNKKDKIIDLMAEELVEAQEYFYSEFDNFSKEDFIEYFERKATNND